jgi:hypothetical protein
MWRLLGFVSVRTIKGRSIDGLSSFAGAAHAQDADCQWNRRCEDGGASKRCEDGGASKRCEDGGSRRWRRNEQSDWALLLRRRGARTGRWSVSGAQDGGRGRPGRSCWAGSNQRSRTICERGFSIQFAMCMDNLTYGSGGKKVVNNGTE